VQQDDEFRVWMNAQPHGAGQLGCWGAWLKQGPRVAKMVMVTDFGNPMTGAVSTRKLRCMALELRPDGRGWDFDSPKASWTSDASS
jgi:hypothetical protein